MTGGLRTTAVAALLMLIAACGGGHGTPEATLETLRAALAARDGATFLECVPKETRAFFRDNVRVWKARLDRDDADPAFLGHLPLDQAEIRALDERAVTEHWMSAANPMVRHQPWLDTAVVTAERSVPATEDERCLTLRGRDGSERELWFVREDGRWMLDYLRTTWVH